MTDEFQRHSHKSSPTSESLLFQLSELERQIADNEAYCQQLVEQDYEEDYARRRRLERTIHSQRKQADELRSRLAAVKQDPKQGNVDSVNPTTMALLRRLYISVLQKSSCLTNGNPKNTKHGCCDSPQTLEAVELTLHLITGRSGTANHLPITYNRASPARMLFFLLLHRARWKRPRHHLAEAER